MTGKDLVELLIKSYEKFKVFWKEIAYVNVCREFPDILYKTFKLTIINKERHSFCLRFYYLIVKAASSHVLLTWPRQKFTSKHESAR